jgi:hypothetical protein
MHSSNLQFHADVPSSEGVLVAGVQIIHLTDVEAINSVRDTAPKGTELVLNFLRVL